MYGDDLENTVSLIDKSVDVLVIVGAEKVDSFFYEHADFNVSVGNQPHSEVAALAVFLDRFFDGGWMNKSFDGELKIIPSSSRKKVVSKKRVG